MSTPEWLRPVSERFLGDDPGPPPRPVRVAAVLAGVNALASAGMVAIWAPMAVRLLGGGSAIPIGGLALTAALTLAGAGLFAAFAPSTVLLTRRGWYRQPVFAGCVLGGLALLGVCIAAEPSRLGDEELRRDWTTAGAVLPWLVGTAVSAFGMVLLLRTGTVSNWLAARRYQHRRADAAGSPGASGAASG